MILKIYPDRAALMTGLSGVIAQELATALRSGPVTLSVPGGTTPGPVLAALSDVDLDWARVFVLLNDERWVGEESPRSNTRLLREHLLCGKAAKATLLPLYAPSAQPEDRLAELAQGIAPHLPLTVLLLGMGNDMHTASLFPGADQLDQALAPDAPVLMALRSQAAGEPRITLSARVLQAATHIHVLITGPEKRQALDRALTLPPHLAPIRTVLDQATVHWAE